MGLSVGLIQSTMTEAQRKEAYSADVTYATNQELGFDYLRDHLTVTQDGKAWDMCNYSMETSSCLLRVRMMPLALRLCSLYQPSFLPTASRL